MERENLTAAWIGIEAIGESGFDARAFVKKRQRSGMCREFSYISQIESRPRSGPRLLLWLRRPRLPSHRDRAGSPQNHAHLPGDVSYCDATCDLKICLLVVLNFSAGFLERLIDLFASVVFRSRHAQTPISKTKIGKLSVNNQRNPLPFPREEINNSEELVGVSLGREQCT